MNTTELRQQLSDYHSFLELAWAVSTNHSSASDEFHRFLNSMLEFLRTASSRDIRERGKELEARLQHAVRAHEKVLPKKKSVREITYDFRLLVTTEPDVWRFGILHGWLLERFDVSGLPQAKDFPRHARVGIGVHAGGVSVEEVSLLEDTFFLLVRARKSFESMMHCASSQSMASSPNGHMDDYKGYSALNSSICTYSRLGVLTAVAFVEAFVNSVGWHEVAARSNLSEQEKTELQGTRKGRYLNLESKLERIPRIIRPDKTSTYNPL